MSWQAQTPLAAVVLAYLVFLFAVAWAAERFGRRLVFYATLMIYVGGVIASALAWDFWSFALFRLVTGLGIYGTFWGVILPAAAAAFGIFLARQFFLSIPDEIVEAARIDGAGHLRIFLQVVLPLCRPLVAVLLLLTFLGSWNDYLRQMMTLHKMEAYTAPLALGSLVGPGRLPFGAVFAGSALTMLPVIALFALCARRLFRTLAVDSSAGE